MANKIDKQLNANIDELIHILQNYDSATILRIAADRLSFPNYSNPYERTLSSLYNQLFYLAGLVLANPSSNNRQIDDKSWREIEQLLESIFSSYIFLFLPDSLQKNRRPSEEWFHIREVTMVVFLKYYNESILAHNEQIIERLNCLFGKFNNVIQREVGLKVEEIISMIEWIQTTEQKNLDDFYETRSKAEKERDIFISKWEQEKWNLENARKSIKGTHLENLLTSLIKQTSNILIMDLQKFTQAFGLEMAGNFLKLFMSKRGDKYTYKYMTDTNPAALAPIVEINNEQAICLSNRQLYVAAIKHFENIVRNSQRAQSFFSHRGEWVENKTYEIIRKYFNGAKIYRNIYELPNSQNEHDILILLNNRILIVEVKTSPPKPPPIDPKQAFIKIRNAFLADTGIQGAYDQGLNLKHLIESNNRVNLYDKQGNTVLTIDESFYKHGFNIICITLDDFGSLATDLSLLLEKPPEEKYPFVTNLYDFETLLWGFGKERKNEIDFLRYLDEREKLHGKVYALDELEIANHFLEVGNFHAFDEADKISFDITNTSIFDRHYFAEQGAKYPIKDNDRKGPYYVEIKRQGDKIVTGIKGFPDTYEEIDLTHNLEKTKGVSEICDEKKIGRNDPCPCGSGKKYKKCCGKNMFGLH